MSEQTERLSADQRAGASLVLGGGIGLGAFEAGAIEVIASRPDVDIRSVSGASIGAINGAIFAGNRPEDRVARLRAFWEAIAVEAAPRAWADPFGWADRGALRRSWNWTNALTTLSTGVPSLFHGRALLSGRGEGRSLYDNAVAARTLGEYIDFDLLNRGPTRFCLATSDIEKGEVVFFDTERGERITAEHLLASSSLLTLFEPVRIGDRLLADGGLCCNVPLEAEIGPARAARPEPLCLAIDLFTPAGPPPTALNKTVERSFDMLFGMQSRLRLMALEREWRLRAELHEARSEPGEAPSLDLFYLSYRGSDEEAGFMKPFDLSPATIADRWEEGRRAGARALDLLDGVSETKPGLRVHQVQN
ncbi:MAG: patatin-like phospholipase family protein [Sphingobium sp.]|nr:patatin-like phospholipase family protein [Sphingobium sp.]